MKEAVDVIEIVKWIAVIVFLAVMAWWVLGSSPTIEQVSLAVGLIACFIAWRGHKDSRLIRAVVLSNHKLLKDIHSTLEKRK